jgi:hypothetical protein
MSQNDHDKQWLTFYYQILFASLVLEQDSFEQLIYNCKHTFSDVFLPFKISPFINFGSESYTNDEANCLFVNRVNNVNLHSAENLLRKIKSLFQLFLKNEICVSCKRLLKINYFILNKIYQL